MSTPRLKTAEWLDFGRLGGRSQLYPVACDAGVPSPLKDPENGIVCAFPFSCRGLGVNPSYYEENEQEYSLVYSV